MNPTLYHLGNLLQAVNGPFGTGGHVVVLILLFVCTLNGPKNEAF